MDFVTYILYSKTRDSYYIGYTSNMEARLIRHNQKSKGFSGLKALESSKRYFLRISL